MRVHDCERRGEANIKKILGSLAFRQFHIAPGRSRSRLLCTVYAVDGRALVSSTAVPSPCLTGSCQRRYHFQVVRPAPRQIAPE